MLKNSAWRIAEKDIKTFLDEKVEQYNKPEFIKNDPIVIPHAYSLKQDIEITALWAAMLAWGQRVTIIKKCRELFALMDNAPYHFMLGHTEQDLKRLENFKHRTFNFTDTLYFISFFKHFYKTHASLEDAFLDNRTFQDMETSIIQFHNTFFSLEDFPRRTIKHIPTPARNSACKRMNMFLRWMVRKDSNGVDFGIWSRIKPADLICPCDLHVDRVARRLGLITRKTTDWQTAIELTENLKAFDPEDPVKYDFALFGLGIEEKF